MPHQSHLICGLPGAGKTTYAEQLRHDLNGVRFSMDEWNDRLFYMDRDPGFDFQWFYKRFQRSGFQMRETAVQIIETGAPVIFDCSLPNRRERNIFYDWAAEHAFSTMLHYIDCDIETRWQRVQVRNSEKGETYRLDVTREIFDFMQSVWQAPDEQEMVKYDCQHITN